jgi:hypothetical protein
MLSLSSRTDDLSADRSLCALRLLPPVCPTAAFGWSTGLRSARSPVMLARSIRAECCGTGGEGPLFCWARLRLFTSARI